MIIEPYNCNFSLFCMLFTCLQNGAVNVWGIRDDTLANSGQNSWFVQAIGGESEQSLFTINPVTVTGTQPVLRFYHWYNTEYASDGGWVEVSTDGAVWERIPEAFFSE